MLIFLTLNQLFTDVFKNNASRSEAAEKRHNQNYFMEMITVEGVYDYLMYVGTHRVLGCCCPDQSQFIAIKLGIEECYKWFFL